MDQEAVEQLSDKPYSVLVIIKFFHDEERYEVLVWPTRSPFEHDAILKKYEAHLRLVKHPGTYPYVHKLSFAEKWVRYGDSSEVIFKDDIKNRDEYVDVIENTLFIPHKLKTILTASIIVNRIQPEKNVSFVKADLEKDVHNWEKKHIELPIK